METKYDVEMTVPLGMRKGVMTFIQEKGKVSGTFEILGSVTEFKGRINQDEFIVEGVLQTAVRGIEYSGYGKITDDGIEIKLISDDNTYKIKGRKKVI